MFLQQQIIKVLHEYIGNYPMNSETILKSVYYTAIVRTSGPEQKANPIG